MDSAVTVIPLSHASSNLQGFGSGFNQVSGSGSGSVFGSGSRRTKMKKWATKAEIFFRNFMFWSAGCSFLRAEVIFCNSDVLYGGLVIDPKIFNFFSTVNYFQFLVIKTLDTDLIRIGIQPKMLDPDPYKMNTDRNTGNWDLSQHRLQWQKLEHKARTLKSQQQTFETIRRQKKLLPCDIRQKNYS